jgi:antitoxin (DNA-binding transcriptional repressor) of toxin-antitoxin stability system
MRLVAMMVTVAKAYELDYAGRAVGEAYRDAGYYLAATEAGEARHLVRPRRRTAGLAECQQVGRVPYNLLFGSRRAGGQKLGRAPANAGRPWISTGVWLPSSWARNATYMTYIRSMSENSVPLPYEVQEMTTTEARKHLPELVNMAAYGHVTTVLIRDGRRLARIVPEEDAWIYSPAWQEKLREAEADLAAGRVQQFEDDDEFLGHLDALADEAGG